MVVADLGDRQVLDALEEVEKGIHSIVMIQNTQY